MTPPGTQNKAPTYPVSLCAPVAGVTCFHCCPPIRPADHDTWPAKDTLQPILEQNTRNFEHNLSDPQPIDGTHCWALGFLNGDARLAGCLLHPARHKGKDLRPLTGFGEKCARELCLEARVFDNLTPEEQKRCLACAPTDDPFRFSSRSENPLMRLLAFEDSVMRGILEREQNRPLSRNLVLADYAPLFGQLDPTVDGYWLTRIVQKDSWAFLEPEELQRYLTFRKELEDTLTRRFGNRGPDDRTDLPMAHTHDIPLSLSRWLKFGAGLWRASDEEMALVRELIETEFSRFVSTKGD